MTTRKILISNEYLRLCKNIDNILDKSNILTNINDYDFTDIIYIFNIYFMDCDDSNYKDKISNLLNIGSIEISNTEKNLVYEPIYVFVKWYKNLTN